MRTKKAHKLDERKSRDLEKAMAQFSEQLMSNSKWVRLMKELVAHSAEIQKVEFKKIQGDIYGEMYFKAHMEFNWDFYRDGIEGSNSLIGLLFYKEIEWLAFPRLIDSDSVVVQNLNRIEEILQSIGQFCLERDEEVLKLICYR